MKRYLDPDSTQTLREALAEFRSEIPDLVDSGGEGISPEAKEIFNNHDICHVIFGLSTDLRDETLADVWSVCGTTVSLGEYLQYLKAPEAQQVVKEAGILKALKEAVKVIPRAIQIILIDRRKLKGKLPWRGFEPYMDRPINEIRKEFNIEVQTVLKN